MWCVCLCVCELCACKFGVCVSCVCVYALCVSELCVCVCVCVCVHCVRVQVVRVFMWCAYVVLLAGCSVGTWSPLFSILHLQLVSWS